MKQHRILIIFFIFISLSAIGQDSLNGKWYMFSRNRMIELNIQRDAMISKQLNWDLSERNRSGSDTLFIKGSKSANGNIYLYLTNPKRTANKILLNTFRIVRPEKEIFIALNNTEEPLDDVNAVNQYIQKDTSEKYGMPLFSESEIHRLKAQKKVEEMTEADFKAYANKLIHSKAQLDSLSKLTNSPGSLLYYGYAMIRITFAQIGYNPLITSDEFEKLILRFKNNPETKELVSKMFDEK